jgi:phospholipid/cholesterol/gamma-HCH transport system permease protein
MVFGIPCRGAQVSVAPPTKLTDNDHVRIFSNIGRWFIGFMVYLGGISIMCSRIVYALRKLFSSYHLVAQQMLSMGVRSLPLVLITSAFTGAVAAWQAAYQMQNYIPMRYLGTGVGKAVVIELAPVLTALVVAGRVGASIAAELGTMRVTEQVDALEVMGIDPVRYLVMPRVVSGAIMLPALVMFADLIAILGALVVAVLLIDLSTETFLNGVRMFLSTGDVWAGLIKAAVFGVIIAVVGSYQGFNAKGGAEGVGRATTSAVVTASVLILVADYFIATALFKV